jgi:hypothetical protein
VSPYLRPRMVDRDACGGRDARRDAEARHEAPRLTFHPQIEETK